MTRTSLIRAALGAALALTAACATVHAEEKYPPLSDALAQTECSACHMAFSAAFLPARSWNAVMAGLEDHFGENAALDAAATQQIASYLAANAADTRRRGKFMRNLDASATPLRITETPYWLRKHRPGEVSPAEFLDPKVGSKANCVACHRDAARGNYDDD